MYSSIILKEIYFTIVVSSASILVGIGFGFPAQVLPDLQTSKEMLLSKNSLSWIGKWVYISFTSLLMNFPMNDWAVATTGLIFRPLGALVDLLMIDLVGRRTMLQAMAMTSAVGWAIVSFSTSEIILCAGRAVTSFGVGMVAAPLTYIAEMSEPRHRAVLLQIACSFILLGTEVIYILNTLFHWRIASKIVTVYSFMFLLSLYTIPESCQWYILKNRITEAKNSCKWAKNCDDELAHEKIQEIINNSGLTDNDKNKESFLKNLKKSNIYKPMVILMMMHILRLGLGYEVFSGYAVQMVSQLHTPYVLNVVVDGFGSVNYLFSFFACYLVHKFKKRGLLMTLACIMIVSLIYVIVNLELLTKNKFVHFPFIRLFFFTLYMLIASVSQQISIGIIAELFPLNYRGTMFGIIAFIIFSVAALYTHLYGEFGVLMSFTWVLCFAALNGVLFFFVVLFFVPETKNKSLTEIENYFKNKSGDRPRIATIEMEAGANGV